jgi:hypothetical protein
MDTRERYERERRKRVQDQVIWTVMVAVVAGVVGTWVIDRVEASYYCVDRLEWLALPKGEGTPPSPTGGFDPTLRDYVDCIT